jgi:hypothetical protein
MLWARIHTGEGTVVPLTGLATVIFAANAGWDSERPDRAVRNKKATARPGFLPEDEQFLLMNNIDLLGDDYISISVSSVMRAEGAVDICT